MTVKELIEQLEQVEDKTIEVVIRGTSPDEWTYMNGVESVEEVSTIMNELDGLIEVDEETIDEEELHDHVRKVLVIDGGMF
jgi:hypothetical protein